MKKDTSEKNRIRRVLAGRAACTVVCAVTAFLCVLTLLEFAALRFEWQIPALYVLAGERGFWSEECQREELALDVSTENELLEESVVPEDGTEKAEDAVGQGALPEDAPVAGEAVSEDVVETEEEKLPYYIRINRRENCITVYTMDDAGAYTVPYKAMICSTGLYNATPRGVYQISTKYRWRELYGNVYGQYATRIYRGVLFHSVPYYKKSENTLCTEKYNKLGQQASMGCVRLTVEDAKWIVENCPEGTTVEIYESDDPGPLGKPSARYIDSNDPNRGWDPTDPAADNPWHVRSEEPERGQ